MALTGVIKTPYGNTAPSAYLVIPSAAWTAGDSPDALSTEPPTEPTPWNKGIASGVVNIWNDQAAYEEHALPVYGVVYNTPWDPTVDGDIYEFMYAAIAADVNFPEGKNWKRAR